MSGNYDRLTIKMVFHFSLNNMSADEWETSTD